MKMKSSLFAIVLPVSLLVSCGGGNNTKYKEEDITLNKSSLTLDVGSSETLNVANADLAKESELKWTTSDANIATVEAGRVYAISGGSVIITASFESLASTCTVTVRDPHYAPVIEFDTNKVEIKVGESYPLEASVYVNGSDVTLLSTFVFSTNEEDALELTPDNNNCVTIKALKATSTAKVMATATYNRVVTSSEVDVVVDQAGDVVTLISNTEDIKPYKDGFKASIYVGNITGYTPIVTPNFSVYKNGELVIGPSLIYNNENPDICRYVYGDNIIQSVSSGEGLVEVVYDDYSFPIYVDVDVPHITIENDKYLIELARGDATLALGEEIKGYLGEASITDITYSGFEMFTSYDAANKKITYNAPDGLKQIANYSDSANDYTKEMVIKSSVAVFTCKKVCCLGLLIKNFTDLKLISGAVSTANKYGVYILNNDIDCGLTYDSPLNTSAAFADTGFRGTFDGNNHTIKNLYVGYQGFFGTVASGAVIKNVKFVDCGMKNHVNGDGATYSPFLARHCYPCTLESVEITFARIYGNHQKEKDIPGAQHSLPGYRIQNEQGLLFSIVNNGKYTLKDITIDATSEDVCKDNDTGRGSAGNVHNLFSAIFDVNETNLKQSTISNVVFKVKYYSQFAFRYQIGNYDSMYEDNTKIAIPSGVTVNGAKEELNF